jgi:DNA-binding LacI/PurR family transcriptional regulator
METLAFEPNAGARALASQRSSVVGLVVPFGPHADPVAQLPFIETIASVARERDHEVLLVSSDEGSAGLRRLAGRKLCDAIVLMGIEANDDRIPVAASLGLPVVLVGVPADPQGLFCVDLDFEQAARMAVDELASTGHDRVVMIGYPSETIRRDLNFVSRFLGSGQRAASERGLQYDLVTPVDRGRTHAHEAVEHALAWAGPERVGLVVASTAAFQPVLRALASRGVVLGQDVSLVGLCTDREAEDSEPPITNVSLEPRDVSRRAMEILFDLLEPTVANPPPAIELVTPHLTRRGTVMHPS